MKSVYHIGMDVHKEEVRIAVLKGQGSETVFEKTIENDVPKIIRILSEFQKKGDVVAAYEAGCMGYTLYRAASKKGIDCRVLAPNKIVRAGSDKIKTDKRDAILIARMLKHEEGESIYIPTADDEATRDLLRCRNDLKDDMRRAKQRLTKFLLRLGHIYDMDRYWTQRHRAWMKTIAFKSPMQQETFDQYICSIAELEQRIERIDAKVIGTAQSEPYKERVDQLRCLKGIDYIIALSLVCEVGDFRRFKNASSFMSYLGLVPSEFSSGKKRRQGGITKTGNGNLRRLLTEAGWQYMRRYQIGKGLAERRMGMSERIIGYADKAMHRLHSKFDRIVRNGKSSKVAVTATARELAGFIWGMMNQAYC
jgi:transposase